MLYDRPYMRPEYRSSSGISALKWILIVTFSAFLLQSIFYWWFGTPWMERAFSLSQENIGRGFFWTLLTYALLHSTQNPFHIIFNMLLVFLIGRIVQREIGAGRFLSLYLACILVGAFAWIPLNPQAHLLGASAGAIGILTIFCLRHADEEITFLLFLIIPVRVKPRVILYCVLAFELFGFAFFELSSQPHQVAFSAHLGGILGAWLYHRFLLRRDNLFQFGKRGAASSAPRRERQPTPTRNYSVNISSRPRAEIRMEVDRILDKINANGFGSLSDEEKKLLYRARDLLSR